MSEKDLTEAVEVTAAEGTALVEAEREETKGFKMKIKKIGGFIKAAWKKVDKKKFVFLSLFFMFLYFMTEFLNGNNVEFVRFFSFETGFKEKWEIFMAAGHDFFKFPKFFANYFLFVFLYWILYGITNRTKFSLGFITVFFFVFGCVNYFVTDIRGISVTISDIYSIRTAMNVSNGLQFSFEGNFWAGLILFVGLVVVLWRIRLKENREERMTRSKLLGVTLGVFGILAFFGPNYITSSVELWNINRAYANSGAGLTLVRMTKDLRVKKPEGYDKLEVMSLLARYDEEVLEAGGETGGEDGAELSEGAEVSEASEVSEAEDLPNVLIILNESFSDLEGSFVLNLYEDPIEEFHKLQEQDDVITGVMHSSQYGGGTANIEWEVLTQNVTAFLPSGAMPYQQYIHSDVKESAVSFFNRLGYETWGIHSWDKSGYSREKIYDKFLGFDHSMFKDGMTKLVYDWREYPSDMSTFEEYYEVMDNKESGELNFTFLTTMENHTPYYRVNPDGIWFTDDWPLNCYFWLEYESDKAVRNLYEYVQNYDEKLVVLMFGDHQPSIEQKDHYELTGEYSYDEADHVTPFVIFANYDLGDYEKDIETSPNYLQSILYEKIGLEAGNYSRYLSELREEIPVITNLYYKDKDGNSYSVQDKNSPYYDRILEYSKVVYYNLFDNK